MNRTLLAAIIGIAGLCLLAATAVIGLKIIDGMAERAASAARSERDHYWRSQVEQMKATAQAEIAENLKQTMAAQDAARDQVAEAERRAAELEKENAALPNGSDRGIGRDRVRLLNKR